MNDFVRLVEHAFYAELH